jgi:hypothetical protein
MKHTIKVEAETLSDGSTVYNVVFGKLTLPAVSEVHADLLADKIAAAINEHSVDEAVGKYVW